MTSASKAHWSVTVTETQLTIAAWRVDYNTRSARLTRSAYPHRVRPVLEEGNSRPGHRNLTISTGPEMGAPHVHKPDDVAREIPRVVEDGVTPHRKKD